MTRHNVKRIAMNAGCAALFAAAAITAASTPVAAAPILPALKSAIETQSSQVQLAHAQSFRHCHNVHHRVYCHKRERLPMNWPPFSGEKNRKCAGDLDGANGATTPARNTRRAPYQTC